MEVDGTGMETQEITRTGRDPRRGKLRVSMPASWSFRPVTRIRAENPAGGG